jgi:5-methylcytosine-specific restriction endonuclease McrA
MTHRNCELCSAPFSFDRTGMRGRHPKFCDVCKADKAKLKAHYYANYKDTQAEAYLANKPVKACFFCGVSPIRKHSGKYCSLQCEHDAGQAREAGRDAVKRQAKNVENVVPRVVFERDNWVCYICGEVAPPEFRGSHNPLAPEIDHVTPLRLGGDHDYANVKTSHRKCNAAKGGFVFTELVALAKKIAAFHG